MVEGDRDVTGPGRRELAVADDRAFCDPTDAENRDLGVVDDRRLEQPGELARARDRERRAAELLRLEGACPGGLSEALDLLGELADRGRVAAADDRRDEPLLRLDGNAEVVAVEVHDLVALEP